MATVRALLAHQSAPFLVPLGVGAHLDRWGVPAERIVELDWSESHRVAGLTVTATAAQHFSGRGLRRDGTLWSSWVVAGAHRRVFYTGDSGYFDGYAEIGAEHGPFDVTLMQIGAYDRAWPSIHMFPEEAVAAHLDLRGGLLIPVHWATFNLALHDWAEPVNRLWARGEGPGRPAGRAPPRRAGGGRRPAGGRRLVAGDRLRCKEGPLSTPAVEQGPLPDAGQSTKASVQSAPERPESASSIATACPSVSCATKSMMARPRAWPIRSGVRGCSSASASSTRSCSRRGSRDSSSGSSSHSQQRLHQGAQQPGLAALVQGQVGPGQHEPVVDELEHLHLVPLRRGRAARARSGPSAPAITVIASTNRVGPAGGEAGHVLLRLDRAVEGQRQQPVHQLLADVLDGGGERVVVGDPGVLAVQLPAQPLDRRAGTAGRGGQRRVGDRPEVPALALPGHQLGGHRALLEHPDPVEVLHVVDGVRDVVGGVHDGRLDGLLPVRDPPGERLPGLPQVVQLGAVRAELRPSRSPGRPAAAVAPRGAGSSVRGCGSGWSSRVHGYFSIAARTAAVRSSPVVAAPRISVLVTIRYDWALPSKPSAQAEALPGQPVQHPLPQVPERRVTEVVGERGRLHHVRVAAAELRPAGRGAPPSAVQPLGDRAGHLGHLQAVGEPVVHQQARSRPG